MAVKIQLRRGSEVEWSTANPTLAIGEVGINLDTYKFKIGNGVTPWNSLPYSQDGVSIQNVLPPLTFDGATQTLGISLDKSDVGLDQVDNTSDLNKPVSTAQQSAIDSALTSANAYTDTALAEVVGLAPEVLDTLKEISDALGGDENFSTTINNAINQKVSKSGDTMSGPLRLVDLTTSEEPALATLPEHAVNKKYVDEAVAGFVPFRVNYFDLTAEEVLAQSVVLPGVPTQPSRVLFDVLDGGGAGQYIKDFIVSGDTLSWGISEGRFESVLIEGDTLRIVWY